MGQTKQAYLDWLCQQSKCHYCGDAAEDCECSRGQTMFTKGTWEYTEELGANFSMIGADNVVICGLPNPLGADDCSNSPEEMKKMRLDKELVEMRANAQLISAAPDLYYALKAILIDWEEILDRRSSFVSPEIEMAKDAIAKAEGK